jgi:hypothetical protein
MAFADIPLYRYNTAREGQTMDLQVQIRSLSQLVSVTKAMAQFFITYSHLLTSPIRKLFLRNIVADRIRIVYRKYLLAMPSNIFKTSNFSEVDELMTDLLAKCGIEEFSVPVNNKLKIDLLAHWRKRNRRYGVFRVVLAWLDRVMNRIHTILFRRK